MTPDIPADWTVVARYKIDYTPPWYWRWEPGWSQKRIEREMARGRLLTSTKRVGHGHEKPSFELLARKWP